MIPPTSLALSKPCRAAAIAYIGPVELLDPAGQIVGLPEGAGDERVVAHYRLLEKLGEGAHGLL